MRCLAIFFVVYASWAQAQIAVRTGDHASFTRVILNLPDGTDWEIGRIDGGYGIRLATDEPLETESFFRPISRQRVAAIATNASQLNLTLGCACYASAFLDASGWLVVDIRDGLPPKTARFEEALGRRATAPVLGPARPDPVSEPIDPVLTAQIASSAPRPRHRSLLQTVPLARLADQTSQVSALEAAVAASLNRAFSQGLVESASDIPAAALAGNPGNDVSLEELLRDISQLHTPGVAVTTSIDAARRAPGLNAPDPVPNVSCLADDLFELHAWGDDRSFADQMSAWREAITGEFDRTDPQAVETLARGYLFFGFGREAAAALEIDGNSSRTRSVLVAIGKIIDGDPVKLEGFTRQMGCPGHAALWGLLAHRGGPMSAAVDTAQVTRTFRDLPMHLQLNLGPRLAAKMRQLGANVEAGVILNGIETSPDAGPDVDLARSLLASDRGDLKEAAETLEALVQDNPRITAEALIDLVSLQIRRDVPVAAENLAMIDVLIFENSGAPVVAELRTAKIRALIHNEDFSQSIEELLSLRGETSAEAFSPLREEILMAIADRAPDVTFLEIMIEDDVFPEGSELRNDIAARLISLGFPEQAADYLDAKTNGSVSTHQTVILMPDPHPPISHQAGEPVAVPPPTPDFGMANWRAGNWIEMAQSRDPLLEAISTRILSEPQQVILDHSPLAAGSALIADSENLRATLTDLMTRFPAPDAP